MGDNRQMSRNINNFSRSIPPPPPPPPPPPIPSNSPSRPAPSLAAGLSSVSLKQRPPESQHNMLQSKSVSNISTGPFRLPPASTLKKVRPPLPPTSGQPSFASGYSNRSVDPLFSGRTQGRNSASNVPNDSPDSYRSPAASTLPRKLRPPLPPPPPPSIPPSGFSNNSSKFIPPPPSQATSINLRKPDPPPKNININGSNRRPLTSMTNLESRFRHVFKDLHTLPAPEPFLSTKKQYPSERRPRGPAPPIPSRSASVSNTTNHNGYNNNSSIFNSMPMLHVQLEHQALGVNYQRY